MDDDEYKPLMAIVIRDFAAARRDCTGCVAFRASD
jgi:hypothetical protein